MQIAPSLHDAYGQWSLHETHIGFSIYRASRLSDSLAVRCAIFHDADSSILRRTSVRHRLANLLNDSGLLTPLDVKFSGSSNYVIVAEDFETTFESALVELTSPLNRLRSIAKLTTTFRELHRVGLPLGAWNKQSIFLLGTLPTIDPLGIFGATNYDEQDYAEEADVAQLARMVSDELAGLRTSDGPPQISPRKLAVLRLLLDDALSGNRNRVPTIIELDEFIGSLLADLNFESGETTIQPPEFESEQLSNDRTLEAGTQFCLPTELQSTTKDVVVGQMLGRFKLVRLIGCGGMGNVYLAEDVSENSKVAVKVIRGDMASKPQAVRRMLKESRLMQELSAPQILRLIDAGEDRSIAYMALELVEGSDLKKELQRNKKFDPNSALQIIYEIAKGLSVAHRAGIIHRDIKPENILLARRSDLESLSDNDQQQVSIIDQFAIKISDFGIARQIQQSQSLEVTMAGTLLGTPSYMSPEQCKSGASASPASDVYSLGVMLFQLITGELPFVAEDLLKLVGMHCYSPAPDVRRIVPEITDIHADLIARMLAKDPAERFADAGQLIDFLDKLSGGDAAIDVIHQIPNDSGNLWSKEFAWELPSSPDQLWPYVADTERLNRAIGLPSVKYRTQKDPQIGLRRFGQIKLGLMNIDWEEHPFEWIEGQRMGVHRVFSSGPFKTFASFVSLELMPNGGSRLRHKVEIVPRNSFGKLLANIEIGWKAQKSLDRVYRRIDKYLQNKSSAAGSDQVDAFEETPRVGGHRKTRLNQRRESLIEQGVAPEIAEVFVDYLASLTPQRAAKIRPLPLADDLKLGVDETIDTCLVAASIGMLDLSWDLLCPTCRAPSDSKNNLADIARHTHCEACDFEFATDLGNAVEMIFQLAKDLGSVDSAVYCIGGPSHAPHVVMQTRIAPNEQVEFETKLGPGSYILRGPKLPYTIAVNITDKLAASKETIHLPTTPKTIAPVRMLAGRQSFRLRSEFPHELLVRLERTATRNDAVTAGQAATLDRFRTLFPTQVVKAGRILQSQQVCMLVTQIFDMDLLYSFGDESLAFEWLSSNMERQTQIVARHRGSVIKTLSEGLVAVFDDIQASVNAAAEILSTQRSNDFVDDEQLATLERAMTLSDSKIESGLRGQRSNILNGFAFKVGLHRGRAYISSSNGRIDYFGAALRTAMAVPQMAASGLIMTDAIYADPQINEWLIAQKTPIQAIVCDLPGLPEQVLQQTLFDQGLI